MPLGDAVGPGTPEEQVASLVDAVVEDPRRRDDLVGLLPERSPLYAGRSTTATVRMRGYAMAAFERVGLPEAALPYVLDELQNGRDAYLVAAAARALRGFAGSADDAVPFLRQAIENIRDADDAVSFDSYKPRWPAPDRTTAMDEIGQTLAWLGLPAGSGHDGHCCHPPSTGTQESPVRRVANLLSVTGLGPGPRRDEVPLDVEMEDQDGRGLTYGGFFRGRPSVVAFFYTRCDNPNKCSLTISRLAELRRALDAEGLRDRVQTAAITYDPDYDLAPRLRAYGENRGVTFGPGDRLLRARTGFERLDAYFELGVNYGPVVVNRHRVELFLLDGQGRIARTFARLRWDLDGVLRQARALAGTGRLAQP
jgi:protein SCO1/2